MPTIEIGGESFFPGFKHGKNSFNGTVFTHRMAELYALKDCRNIFLPKPRSVEHDAGNFVIRRLLREKRPSFILKNHFGDLAQRFPDLPEERMRNGLAAITMRKPPPQIMLFRYAHTQLT